MIEIKMTPKPNIAELPGIWPHDSGNSTTDPTDSGLSGTITNSVKCSSGQFKDPVSEACLDCSAGCSKCTSADQCSSCQTDHIMHQNKCEQVTNCLRPGPTSDESQLHRSCLACPDDCAFCAKATAECSLCKWSFYLQNGKCNPCSENCRLCLDESSCSVCEPEFTLVGQGCVRSRSLKTE